MKGHIMTENIESIVVTDEEIAPTRFEKIKAAAKQVDPKVYGAAAIAVIAAVGFAAYKRIENFEEREEARLAEAAIEETAEV
ncbi:membrane protein [Gordonia phage Avazak]|uniref:Membrane protein n=1 Tax=Gordonia phage Avazak TaxID=2656529 RepID=A0A649V7X6_9CAUD|nr:membrane protein [Gordonia phage Avazak]QGJ88072.1 membrane protein [Gordonia phage Avazak]